MLPALNLNLVLESAPEILIDAACEGIDVLEFLCISSIIEACSLSADGWTLFQKGFYRMTAQHNTTKAVYLT